MIPVSVSDILKILDQIPIWKAVSGLPRRISESENRIAVLEKQNETPRLPAAAPVPEARICPLCGDAMKVTAETGHPMFGQMGLKIHVMECPSCGNKAQRDFKPGKGYNI